MIERTDFMSVPVQDMERAKRFYSETLEIHSPNLEEGWPEFETGNVSLYLVDPTAIGQEFKPHTSFTGRYESGLLKMLTIGLGKRAGAGQVHKLGLPGLKRMLPEVGAFLLEKTPVVLGLAVVCAVGGYAVIRRATPR